MNTALTRVTVGVLGLISFYLCFELLVAEAQQQVDASHESNGLPGMFPKPATVELPPSILRLDRVLSELKANPDADEIVGKHIENARSMLEKAMSNRMAGNIAVAERLEKIIDATIVLAERKLALHHTKKELSVSREQEEQANKEVESAREALESALIRRARLYLESGP